MPRLSVAVLLISLISMVFAIPGFTGPCSVSSTVNIESFHTYSFFGTTEYSEVYNGTECSFLTDESGSTWFRFTAEDGVTVQATTCSEYTNFDTVLSVYSGDCSSLECVTYRDDSSCSPNGLASTVQWTAESNVVYYVSVSGYGIGFGTFELIMSTVIPTPEPPASCDGVSIPGPYFNGMTIQGNTGNGRVLANPLVCGIERDTVVEWYTIHPAEDIDVNINIEGNAEVVVFSATSCSSGSCYASSYLGELTFTPSYGDFHLAVFSTSDNQAEDFTLTISQEVSACESAAAITLSSRAVGESVLISNIGQQSISVAYPCSGSYGAAYWLSFTATTSGTLYVDTCSSFTDFDTILSAYTGDCSSVSCLTYDDDSTCSYTSRASSIDFDISSGETVNVVLTGYYSATGTAGLNYSFYPDN